MHAAQTPPPRVCVYAYTTYTSLRTRRIHKALGAQAEALHDFCLTVPVLAIGSARGADVSEASSIEV